LEPGPAYQATPRDEDWTYDEKDENVAMHDDGGSPSKYSRHGSVYSRRSSGRSSWFRRKLSLRLQGDKTFSWPDNKPTPRCEEARSFLSGGSATRGLSTRTKASTVGSTYTSPSALEHMDSCEDVDMLPYESSRHKSIRNGILERLNFGTSRRQPSIHSNESGLERAGSDVTQSSGKVPSRQATRGHKRADSDSLVEEPSRPAKTHVSEHSPRKERSVVRRTAEGVDETEWIEGSGFRIVEEHLEKMRDQVRDGDGEDGKKGTKIKQSQERDGHGLLSKDKYSPLPVRKTPSKGRSPAVTPTSTPGRIQRADSFLPLSPPQIMSPPLEDILFFQSPTMQMKESKITAPQKTKKTLASKRSRKTVNQLCSPVPSLSFPVIEPHRNRVNKSRAQVEEKDLPLTPPRRPTTTSKTRLPSQCNKPVSTPTRRSTAAERFNARHNALNKVDQIVSRSWSQRDLSELDRIGSPTMFGAHVDSV
jgi:hypothetical protein